MYSFSLNECWSVHLVGKLAFLETKDQPACTGSKHIGNHKISPSTQGGSLPIRFHIKCLLSPQVNHTYPFIKAKFYWFLMRDKDQMGLFCAFGSNAGFLSHHVGPCSQNSPIQGHYTTHNCLNPTSCMLNCYVLGNIAADHPSIHLIMLLLSTSNVSQNVSHKSGWVAFSIAVGTQLSIRHYYAPPVACITAVNHQGKTICPTTLPEKWFTDPTTVFELSLIYRQDWRENSTRTLWQKEHDPFWWFTL